MFYVISATFIVVVCDQSSCYFCENTTLSKIKTHCMYIQVEFKLVPCGKSYKSTICEDLFFGKIYDFFCFVFFFVYPNLALKLTYTTGIMF